MSKDNYDFVKQHNPEAFRKAVAIGSYAHIYAAQIQPSEDPWYEQDHTAFGAQVEKAVMELVADVLRNYHRPDPPGFEPLTEEQRANNLLVNFGIVR
jgi:hypothetical protein